MEQTTLPVAQLCASSSNVRQRADAKQHAFLVASIASTGLINPITVKALGNGEFEVVAGSRRFAAIQDLIASDTLPADYPVKVTVLDNDASALEASLAENIIREGMTVADEVWAFKRLVDEEGLTVAEIATRFGYLESTVQQRLALANLHPEVFAAFAGGGMSLAIAKTFCLTSDQDRQLEVFERFSHLDLPNDVPEELLDEEEPDEEEWLWEAFDGEEAPADEIEAELAKYRAECAAVQRRNAERATKRAEQGFSERRVFSGGDWQVRQALSEDSVRGDDARAKLIGAEAFVAAGGEVTTDLFAEREDGQVFKPVSLLTDLVEAKLIAEADRIKVEGGYEFVTPIARHYIGYEGLPGVHRVSKPGEGEDNSAVGRVLLLSREGAMELDDGFYSTKRPKAESSSSSSVNAGPTNALGAKAINELAYMRREVLQVELMRNPEVGYAYAIFVLVDKQLQSSRDFGTERGSLIAIGDSFYRDGLGYGSETPPYRSQPTAGVLAELDAALNRSWIGEAPKSNRDGEFCWERFGRFLALSPVEKLDWAAWAAQRSLKTSAKCVGDRHIAFHDRLGALLDIDVRSHLTPTAENYFTYLTGGQMLALLEPFPETKAVVAKLKSAERKAFMAKLCDPDELTKADHPEAAAFFSTWTPPELRFADAPKPAPKARPKKQAAKSPARKARAKPKAKAAADA